MTAAVMVRVYEAKYLPAGFTWEQYLAEPAWLVEALMFMWSEQQKKEEEDLKELLRKRRKR